MRSVVDLTCRLEKPAGPSAKGCEAPDVSVASAGSFDRFWKHSVFVKILWSRSPCLPGEEDCEMTTSIVDSECPFRAVVTTYTC
eukprot:6459832-Amphidinium_carterae.1